MTATNALGAPTSSGRIPIVDAVAPAERLALFRVLVCFFTVVYLVVRSPVFLALSERAADSFQPVGIFAILGETLSPRVVPAILATALVTGVASTVGFRFRWAAPIFALCVLVLTSYRSSWGQLLHFENLFTMHLLVLALSPAGDRLSVDERRNGSVSRPGESYGFPLALCSLITLVTYSIAGVAKLRIGGLEWLDGDTLVNHIAYSAARLELLGATPSPLAVHVVNLSWVMSIAAVLVVLVELAAPISLIGGRVRLLWVLAAWAMHVGTLATMFIAFPYPLVLLAFAPLFDLESLPVLRRFVIDK